MKQRQQSSTNYPIPFFMVLSDHVTPATGKTVSVSLSKNGGSFAAASGAVTEISGGWYLLAANATDRNTVGELALRATASGCDDTPDRYVIVPWDPFDGAGLGLSRLDAAMTSRAPAATAVSNADYTTARAGKLDNLDAAMTSRAPAATAVSNTDYTIARAAKLDNLDAAVSTRAAPADVTGLLTATMTEAYAADGAPMNIAQALHMIWSALGDFAISGTTLTCKKLDGSTNAMVFTLNDATNPTSRTRTS